MPQNAFTADRDTDKCAKCGARTPLLFHEEGTGRMICIDCERDNQGMNKKKSMR